MSPNIIVCGGAKGEWGLADHIFSLFRKIKSGMNPWLPGGKNGISYIQVNNKKVWLISISHPSARESYEKQYNEVISVFNLM